MRGAQPFYTGLVPPSLAPIISRTRLTSAALLGLALLALLAALADAPPQRAEVYFLDGALRMLESGNFLVPTFRAQPFFDKPPLATWLMAGALAALEREPWAARLVSVLATLLTALATFTLGRRLLGREAAAAGALVFLATPAVLSLGRLAMSDMLLTLLCLLALQASLAALRPGASTATWALAGTLFGLAFLAKGPVALLVAGAPALLAARRLRARPRAARVAAAGVAFAACGLGWFAWLALRLGSDPLQHFFLQENLARFGGRVYDSGRGLLYYPASYLLLGLPWSPLLPLAAWRLRHESGARLLLGQALLVLVPLTLSRGKIEYYLLPLYPALSLLVGRLLADPDWGRGATRLLRGLALLLAAVTLATGALLGRLPADARPGAGLLALLGCAGLAGAGALLAVAWRLSPRRLLVVAAAVLLSGFAAAQQWLLPALRAGQPNRALRAAISDLRQHSPGVRLALCHDPTRVERELLVHERLVAEQRCDLERAAGQPGPLLLLLHDDEIERLAARPGLQAVGEWTFLPVKTLHHLALGREVARRRVALVYRPPTPQ